LLDYKKKALIAFHDGDADLSEDDSIVVMLIVVVVVDVDGDAVVVAHLFDNTKEMVSETMVMETMYCNCFVDTSDDEVDADAVD